MSEDVQVLRGRVERLEEQLRGVQEDLHGLTAIAQLLARLEGVVDGIRSDLSEMKEEWQRIRDRLHKVENAQISGSAAAEALRQAKDEAARAEQAKLQAQQAATEARSSNWTWQTRWFVLACAGVGAFAAIVAAVNALFF